MFCSSQLPGFLPGAIASQHGDIVASCCRTDVHKKYLVTGNFYLAVYSHTQGYLTAIHLRMVPAGKKYQESAFAPAGISCASKPGMRNTAKKILIVDDNDACRESLGGFIKDLGYEVFEATTGLEVIDRASSLHPDLIMMDLRLPGMNGDEATARLKRNVSTRHIPVVINTSWTTACNVGDRANRALEAGAEEILYKPFHLTMLRDVLRTYLLA